MRPEKPWFVARGRGFDSRHLHPWLSVQALDMSWGPELWSSFKGRESGEMFDSISMRDRDTNGDLYEYMQGKIASAGQNGQFRTPRYIIQLMVEMTTPTPGDVICDPSCDQQVS